jgi:hypothetical protein
MILRIFFIILLIVSGFLFTFSWFNLDSPVMVGVLFGSFLGGMPLAMIGIAISFDPDINS